MQNPLLLIKLFDIKIVDKKGGLVMEEENPIKKTLRFLGEIIAIIMIVRYALLIVEHYVHYLPTEGVIADIINYIGIYAPMALMICVGLSAVWGGSSIIKLIFLIVCAAIVIFTFFPGVADTITNYIGVTPAP